MEQDILVVERFDPCGRRRTPGQEEAARLRRQRDDLLASRCSALSIRAYRGLGSVTAVDILTMGAEPSELGRDFVHRRFFETIASRENRDLLLFVELYLSHSPQGRCIELILRPKVGKPPTGDYRRWHQDHTRLVAQALKELKRLGLGEAIFLARHPRPVANGAIIDLHTHVILIADPSRKHEIRSLLLDFAIDEEGVQEVSRLAERIAYLVRPDHWSLSASLLDTFDEESLRREIDEADPRWPTRDITIPGAAVRTGLSDRSLVEFWAASAGLRWIEVLGPMRRARKDFIPPGSRLTEMPDGELALAPKATKPRFRSDPVHRFSSGPTALAARLSWINHELRPVLLVRN